MPSYQLLVATRKGLVIGRSNASRADWQFGDVAFAGWNVDYAVRDPRSGRIWVAASHMQWGPHLHYSDDDGATWTEGVSPSFQGQTYLLAEFNAAAGKFDAPKELPASLNRVWTVEPGPASQPHRLYAGVDPAGLFLSDDNGASWRLCEGLWNHKTRDQWTPGAAGLILHHIQIDPRDPQHLYIGISAAGIFESPDGGASWMARNRGIAGEHLPRGGGEEAGHCVHSFSLHPTQPDRLYQRNHFGVYRSDDRGETWTDLGKDLPGNFGFASTIDPHDAETFYVVPLQFDQARVPVHGALRVYRTGNAGAAWQPLGDGLPSSRVLQGVYRQALCNDGAPSSDGLGLYLGTSGGHLYASANAGDTWRELLDHLAPVTSVRAAAVD